MQPYPQGMAPLFSVGVKTELLVNAKVDYWLKVTDYRIFKSLCDYCSLLCPKETGVEYSKIEGFHCNFSHYSAYLTTFSETDPRSTINIWVNEKNKCCI